MKRKKSKRSSKSFLTLLFGIAGLGFLVGVITFNFIIMPFFVKKGREAVVPELIGHSLQDAENSLLEQGLRLGKQATAHSTTTPKGFVLSQNPSPGTLVKRGRKVSVVASLGQQWASVPELTSEDLRRAEILVRKAGLKMGSISYAYSDSITKDLITASEPAAGSVVPLDSEVNLLLSLGRYEDTTSMPDLIGLTAGEAENKATSMSLVVIVRSPGGSTTQGSKVYDQRPRPGFEVSAGDTVELIVGR